MIAVAADLARHLPRAPAAEPSSGGRVGWRRRARNRAPQGRGQEICERCPARYSEGHRNERCLADRRQWCCRHFYGNSHEDHRLGHDCPCGARRPCGSSQRPRREANVIGAAGPCVPGARRRIFQRRAPYLVNGRVESSLGGATPVLLGPIALPVPPPAPCQTRQGKLLHYLRACRLPLHRRVQFSTSGILEFRPRPGLPVLAVCNPGNSPPCRIHPCWR